MRGADERQTTLLSYPSVGDHIPADHPLRTIHALVNPMLAALPRRSAALYARMGRPSIPPKQLRCARCCCRCSSRFGASSI